MLAFARHHGLATATRSGGHSLPGTPPPRGVVIDLSLMALVVIAVGVAEVGAGVPLGELYQRLGAHGLIIPAGTCPSVGVGGLTLLRYLNVTVSALHRRTADGVEGAKEDDLGQTSVFGLEGVWPTAGWDFFVSDTQVNRAWAEWIAAQLEAVGYSTLLQAWDFRPGSDFLHQMQDATSTVRRTIAVLGAGRERAARSAAASIAALESPLRSNVRATS